jgi:hypothetical protein
MLWIITCHRLKRNQRGVSNIIVVVLSLVIILAIVSNIILWNYEMNQVDWEKMRENVKITNVENVIYGFQFTFENDGSLTVHLVSLWIINSTDHQRYDISVFIKSTLEPVINLLCNASLQCFHCCIPIFGFYQIYFVE